MTLTPLNSLPSLQPTEAVSKVKPQQLVNQLGSTFGQALDSLNQTQKASDALVQKLAAGENVDLHQVMIAAEEASVSMKVALAMRDKLVEAYQEVMRMQV